eukprot:5629622-Pleurochrysis_carterae.AAC.1
MFSRPLSAHSLNHRPSHRHDHEEDHHQHYRHQGLHPNRHLHSLHQHHHITAAAIAISTLRTCLPRPRPPVEGAELAINSDGFFELEQAKHARKFESCVHLRDANHANERCPSDVTRAWRLVNRAWRVSSIANGVSLIVHPCMAPLTYCACEPRPSH